MNYYASGKYLVVAESFKAAIGVYRRVIGDDPEAMQATAGFGENMDVPGVYEKVADKWQRVGWIEWSGGERAVADGFFVEVKFRDGETISGQRSEDWYWGHDGASDDIVAYRVVS